jgi:hypothetical protein
VSKKQGRAYSRRIARELKTSQVKEFIKRQSGIGNPFTYRFKGFGKISPTALRYLKVFSDIKDLFGTLDGFTIGEIGVGFGGQASLIASQANVDKYHLFDLPEVLDLNATFLDNLGIKSQFEFHDGRKPEDLSLDLLISNYAFSELIRPVQEMYLKNVILKSARGYITWNDIGYKSFGSYSLNELLQIIPGSRVIAEEPLTWPGNTIIVWGIQG